VAHDLKQQSKLDTSANKIKAFLAMNEEKLGSRKTPVKVISPTQTVRK